MNSKVSRLSPWVITIMVCLLTIMCCSHCNHAYAASPEPVLKGAIGVQSGFTTNPWDLNTQTTEAFGEFKVLNLFGPVALFGDLLHNINEPQCGSPWDDSNFRLGLEAPIARDLSCFGFWQRRYHTNDSRYVIGMKLSFDSSR